MKNIIKKGVQKGTIVFLHGNSSSNKVFESILNSNEIKQTMIAYDLPGHGESVEEYKSHLDFSYRFYKEVGQHTKSPQHKQHIWFLPTHKANAKKPKELFFCQRSIDK